MSGDLSKEDKEFLATLTGKSEAEVENYHKVFMIRYPSGKIEMTEFVKMAKEYFEKITKQTSDAESFCNYVFKAYDTDQNGSMSFREAAHAIYVGKKDAPKEEKIKYSFRLYDFNKNGEIDKKELYDCMMGLMKAMGEKDMEKDMEEGIDEMMKEIDTNKDGNVTEEEFTTSCNKDRGVYMGLCRLSDMIGQILQGELMLIRIAEEYKTMLNDELAQLEKSLDDIFLGFA